MLLYVKRQGHLSESEQSDDGTKTAREIYLVVFDSPASAVAAEVAAGVPVRGAAHPEDATRTARSKRPTCLDESNRQHWQVEVTYSDAPPEAGEGEEPEENPLARPMEVSWDFSTQEEAYFVDNDPDEPKPVVNSAGQPFEELLTREVAAIVVSVRRNVTTFDPAAGMTMMDKLNAAPFDLDGVTIAARQAKLVGLGVGPVQIENGVTFREASFTLKIRENWDDVIEDRGFSQLDSNGKLTEIVQGSPPTRVDKPWPLDGEGKAKANPTDKPAPLTFKPYGEMSFAPLFA